MSHELSAAQLARVRREMGLLVEQTSAHHRHLDGLASAFELRPGARATDGTDHHVTAAAAGEAAGRCPDEAAIRQLCVGAREQHATARRVLSALGAPDAVSCRDAVLVVDDCAEVCELVARILRSAGFVIRTAPNGLEGLIAAYEMRPQVIVMDVSMPVLDGIEATRLIKSCPATRDARVIAYTGNPSLGSEAARVLFDAVLHKPARSEVVVATVQRFASL